MITHWKVWWKQEKLIPNKERGNIMSNKFSICIEMIFSDLPVLERIEKVAAMGFAGVEFWGWQDKNLDEIQKKIKEEDLELAAFTGSNNPLTDPDKTEAAVADLQKALEVAEEINSRNIIVTVGQEQEDIIRKKQHDNIIKVLDEVAPEAEAAGVTLVIEPLNIAVDHQGYYLSSSYEGYEILKKVNSPRVKMLFDIYHQQITEGNLIDNFTEHIDFIGHFHMADIPGRHEPGTGELNYGNIFKAIDNLNYNGFVGCEFRPSASSEKALNHLKSLD